jgi:hypothetical protein
MYHGMIIPWYALEEGAAKKGLSGGKQAREKQAGKNF